MFRKNTQPVSAPTFVPGERITSILGPGIIWKGNLRGSGGIRIEGTFEGEIAIRGLLVVGETGRVTCPEMKATTVVVAGLVRGNIVTEKLDIRGTGRVWGDVSAVSFSTEEGAFLRGAVRMEEKIDLNLEETVEELPLELQPPPDSDGIEGAT